MSQTIFEKNFDMLKDAMNTAGPEYFQSAEDCIKEWGKCVNRFAYYK